MSSPPFAYSWTGADVDSLNAPELNSPQPCTHGAGCTYFGSCRFVHPGEEGTGRMRFEARSVPDGETGVREQPACVRLIGNPGFYIRRSNLPHRGPMSWPEWCAREQIPYTPNPPRAQTETNDEAAEVDTQPPPPRATRGRGGGRGGGRGRGAPRGRGAAAPPS